MSLTERLARSPLALAALVFASALLGALAFAAAQMLFPGATGDKAQVEKIVHDYVLDHPEILPEAMDRLRAKQVAQVVDANRKQIVTPFAGAWSGAQKPKVNVVVYTDYACVFCRASLPEIAKLEKNVPDVRIVYRELPVLSAESRVAALWSLAAAQQNRFQPFHDALFAADHLTEASIQAAAQKAGLDMAKAKQFANSQAAADEIDQNLSMAQQLGMSGTPSWVIGDKVVSGAIPYASLKSMVAAARSES